MWITSVVYVYLVAWDSFIGIATDYKLEGPGSKSWWVRGFPHPSRQQSDTGRIAE